MRISRKRLFFLLLLSFSTITFIRLLIITTTFSGPSSRHLHNRFLIDSFSQDPFTSKEFNLIQFLISKRAPCNILFFGLSTPQHLQLARLNHGGNSVFLEDDLNNIRDHRSEGKRDGVEMHLVEYKFKTSEAYDLLRYARNEEDCWIVPDELHSSRCKLALTGLPRVVYKKRWDIIVVDGPSGSEPDQPGRMSAIYTAGLIGRIKKSSDMNPTDVIVHNVNRTVERWFAWEYLCDENLVASKGRLWHFRIKKKHQSKLFCSQKAIQIL
ncbi:glucuronoxylan 4-O-methyltransferase 2-like [Carex rostrata]